MISSHSVLSPLFDDFLSTFFIACCCTDGADDGIERIVAGGMELRSLQTRTGIKFFVTAERDTPDMLSVLHDIYVLYTECVLKDPFYELEMPIRSDLFSQAVDALIDRVEKTGGKR